MNSLVQFIRNRQLDEAEVMNRLQEYGLVSDLCVWADDVAETDAKRAVEWLTK